jgi:hypothetical protein
MKSRFALRVSMAAVFLGLGLGWPAAAQPPQPTSPALEALTSARQGQKFLFILFWKEDSPATQAMKQTLDAALAGRSGQASSIAVNATDPAESAVVAHFGVSRSPMPLVVAVAPNGAITGGFPLKLTEQEANGAFVSPGTAACLKGTQSRKLVLLCVQPAGVQELPAGVREFKADAQYGPATEVVAVRADDPAEAGFLQALKIRPASSTVTAFLAPPGSLLGTFDHTVTKQQFVEKLKSAQNSCCPGGKCGPGGCCAGGKCNPKQ